MRPPVIPSDVQALTGSRLAMAPALGAEPGGPG
jgi:hypothetical protein